MENIINVRTHGNIIRDILIFMIKIGELSFSYLNYISIFFQKLFLVF